MSATIPAGFHALALSQTQLSLAAVLKCGQSFRWSAHPLSSTSTDSDASSQSVTTPPNEYRFCLKDRVICLRQSPEMLFYRSVRPDLHTRNSEMYEGGEDLENLAFIRNYFQLEVDLVKLYDSWSRCDPIFNGLRDRFSGIRMLRQDPWECLISFICSANNNISRITKMVQNLCIHYSSPILTLTSPSGEGEPQAYHPFPPPSVLAVPSVAQKLRELGFGYRAEFIQKTASMLIEEHLTDEGVYDYLHGLKKLSTEDARTELLKLMGVGRKVADCVLLMSIDKAEVVPVDTHVYQIAVKHYGLKGTPGKGTMSPRIYDAVNSKLANIWGAYAGWAHSVLFTADLKSFSKFGLPSPSPSASPEKVQKSLAVMLTPSPSPSPRKRKAAKDEQQASPTQPLSMNYKATIHEESDALADRVKRRRRTIIPKAQALLITETKAEL